MEDVIEIIVLNLTKTKTNKTIVTFATPDKKDSTFKKGNLILQTWFENLNVYDKFPIALIGERIQATYEYQPTYNGTARLTLTDMYDEQGSSILA